jgi:hypothetical protein
MGRYAEFMVCALLTKLGYWVMHLDAPGFDLILRGEDTSLRVQVRSTSSNEGGYCFWPLHTGEYRPVETRKNGAGRLKRRILNCSDTDLLALFHHEFGTTIFMSIADVRVGEVKFPISQVCDVNAKESLERALERLGD